MSRRTRSRVLLDTATLKAWEALRAAAAVPAPRLSALGGAPAAGAPGVRAVAPRGLLRASLRACNVEGMVAEVVVACTGGAVLTAWALALGGGPMLIGFLGALPFLSHLVQFPAAWTTATFGARRTTLVSIAIGRQAYLLLVPLPFLPISTDAKRAVLFAVAAISGVAGVVGNNAWMAWMGDLVPANLRGRYFGKRTALCSIGGSLSALSAGFLLDRAGAHGATLSVLAAIACVAGAVTVWMMSRIHDPLGVAREPFELADALAPIGNAHARRLLQFSAAWNAAVGVSSVFYAVHMLTNLRMGFTWIAAHAVMVATSRMLFSPLWGRALDRVGARPILVACSFGISTLPLIWLLATPDRWWPIALEAILSGFLWSGHALATFTLPLTVAPRKGRAWWLATFSMSAGISFALASSFSGVLAETLPQSIAVGGVTLYGLQALFVLSSLCRFSAACLASRVVQPESRPVEELFRFARERVSGSFARVRFF